jgi:hypothetical protein
MDTVPLSRILVRPTYYEILYIHASGDPSRGGPHRLHVAGQPAHGGPLQDDLHPHPRARHGPAHPQRLHGGPRPHLRRQVPPPFPLHRQGQRRGRHAPPGRSIPVLTEGQ